MSLGSVLNVARNAMNAQQLVIQTAGHNIANVETEGYSRQRVELASSYDQSWTYGRVGTGVSITDIGQTRDARLDAGYRAESSNAAAGDLRHQLLSCVEDLLNEPSDTGLAAAMDAFWSSWSDLAAQPTSAAARSVVQQNGAHVASMLNGFDARLTQMHDNVVTQLDDTVTRINELSTQIAQLNDQIVSAE